MSPCNPCNGFVTSNGFCLDYHPRSRGAGDKIRGDRDWERGRERGVQTQPCVGSKQKKSTSFNVKIKAYQVKKQLFSISYHYLFIYFWFYDNS